VSPEFHTFVIGARFSTSGSAAASPAAVVVDFFPARGLVVRRHGAMSTVFGLLVGGPVQPRARPAPDVRPVGDGVTFDPDRQRHATTGSPGGDGVGMREGSLGLGDDATWCWTHRTEAMSRSHVSLQPGPAADGGTAVPPGSLGCQQLAGTIYILYTRSIIPNGTDVSSVSIRLHRERQYFLSNIHIYITQQNVQVTDIVAMECYRKSYVAYRMAPLPVPLNDPKGQRCCLKPF